MILPFDAHNHIHMGPSPPHVALFKTAALEEHGEHLPPLSLSGMAIMSTHPSDFPKVQQLSEDLPRQYDQNLAIVPCYGVHPWFLHELTDEHWKPTNAATEPCWLEEMRNQLVSNPDSIVGEIGLDGFHFDGTKPDRELSTPMDQQVEAFSLQMRLAHELQRPVSIHTVQCFGPLAQCLGELKKKRQLPPKMYFHAYGGKEGTVDQLLALCGREIGQLYFGFAPIINFRSPKTKAVAQKVGLERILLETDHEDASRVPDSVQQCIDFLADCFQATPETVVERTTKNAMDFYGLRLR